MQTRRAVSWGALGIVGCAALAANACGGGKPPDTTVPTMTGSAPPPPTIVATSNNPPPDGDEKSALSQIVLAAAGAMVSAVRGEPHDSRFDCADASQDLRATQPHAELHNASLVLAGVERLQFFSPARAGTQPSDPGGAESSGGPWFSFRSDLGIWPDGRMRFGSLRSEISTGGPRGEPIDSLPGELRTAARDIVSRLTFGCRISLITKADIDGLPLPEKFKEDGYRHIHKDEGKLPELCKQAQTATGPWQARAEGIVAIVTSDGKMALVQSRFRLEGGHVCLGTPKIENPGE